MMLMQGMGYEVDYIPVGSGERSGDAIALRWGYLESGRGDQCVVVIDGGTEESGAALVEHIRHYYQTSRVDFMICTHCDADHASGLSVVVDQLRVGKLLMHEPWQYADEIHKLVTDGRVTKPSLTRRIEGGLKAAHDLWESAARRRIEVVEPFSGWGTKQLDGTITVLGPTQAYYKQLLSKFRCMPQTQTSRNVPFARMTQRESSLAMPTSVKGLAANASKTNQYLLEQIGITGAPHTGQASDFLGTTSAENNSSAIIFLTACGHKMMFTGDAGVEALDAAITYGRKMGFSFSDLELFHVPHHGSENNIDSRVLDRIRSRVAVVSAAPDGAPRHPSSKVTNDLNDRRTLVYSTQGKAFRYRLNAPVRHGWIPATPIPYDESLRSENSLLGWIPRQSQSDHDDF